MKIRAIEHRLAHVDADQAGRHEARTGEIRSSQSRSTGARVPCPRRAQLGPIERRRPKHGLRKITVAQERACQVRGFEVRAHERCAREERPPHRRARERCRIDRRAEQTRVREDRVVEAGAGEIRAAEISPCEIGAPAVRFTQVGFAQIRALQRGTPQIGAGEVRAGQHRTVERLPGEIPPAEIGAPVIRLLRRRSRPGQRGGGREHGCREHLPPIRTGQPAANMDGTGGRSRSSGTAHAPGHRGRFAHLSSPRSAAGTTRCAPPVAARCGGCRPTRPCSTESWWSDRHGPTRDLPLRRAAVRTP